MDNLNYDDKAKIMYERHLERMRTYSRNHRDKTRETSKKQYQQIKDDPEKYKLYLERRKKEYHTRKAKKIQQKEILEPTVPVKPPSTNLGIIENNDDEIEFKDFIIE
jgi:hypothetical protein